MREIIAVDQFCGGGGTSTGLALTCQERSINPTLYALNHWPIALETHARNHPWAIHRSEEMEDLDPLEVVKEGRADLLVSSPSCVFFSIARGDKPINDQQRSSPWEIIRWAKALQPTGILVENVPEFRNWGPLDAHNQRIKDKAGQTFRVWLSRLTGLGYTYDYRILNAADYGGATSRRRFFLIARKGTLPITWPVPTHSKNAMIEGTKRWRAAAEVIDWPLMGTSIFDPRRTRPMAFATFRRILMGLHRFGGPEIKPFLRGYCRMVGLDPDHIEGKPSKDGPTFILPPLGRMGGITANAPRSVKNPIQTLTRRGGGRLVQPFLNYMEHGGAVKGVEMPFRVITTAKGGAVGLVCPYIVRSNFQLKDRMGAAPRSVDDPMQVALASSQTLVLTEPFIVPVVGRAAGANTPPHGVSEPFHSLQTRVGMWVADATIVPNFGERETQSPRCHDPKQPLPAVTSHGAGILAQAFLVKYNSNGKALDPSEPFQTITAKDRFALVRPVVIDGKFLDIRLRMIQPHELQGAMGFPKSYDFAGTKTEVVRQIGNAIEVNMAKALCSALVSPPKYRGVDSYGG